MGHFQVLFSGELVAGARRDDVQARLAARLRIDERKARRLFSGRTVVLRSELDEHEAYALQSELRTLGARTRVKNRTPVSIDAFAEGHRYDPTHAQRESTLKDITAAHFECPRCGFLQLEAEHCARCGVNLAQAMRERHKEDQMIEKRIRELRERKARAAAQHGRRGIASPTGLRTTASPVDARPRATTTPPAGTTAKRPGGWLRSLLPTRNR
jgi:ribosomal protein L37E